MFVNLLRGAGVGIFEENKALQVNVNHVEQGYKHCYIRLHIHSQEVLRNT